MFLPISYVASPPDDKSCMLKREASLLGLAEIESIISFDREPICASASFHLLSIALSDACVHRRSREAYLMMLKSALRVKWLEIYPIPLIQSNKSYLTAGTHATFAEWKMHVPNFLNYLEEKKFGKSKRGCNAAWAFCRLRRALIDQFQVIDNY